MRLLLVQISEIKVSSRLREARAESVRELADSIAALGLLNPITIDSGYTLIAGLHRLEAAKLLGQTEIECTVSGVTGLEAKLAEIDENFVRSELTAVELGDLLLRRKEIYEELHPEAKNGGDRRSENFRTQNLRSDSVKSFVQDTAEKLGVSPRTVETHIQMAKNLVPAAKEIIKESGGKVTKQSVFRVSRLPPEHQEEAARLLASGEVPYSASGRRYASFEESVADLKNHDKDCSYTPDALLAELDSFIQKFHREFAWYSDPFCAVVFPDISPIQFSYLKKRFGTISAAINDLLEQMKGCMKNEA